MFPDFLQQITSLVSEAKTSLSIVNSIGTHGVFSDRGAWIKYRNAVESLIMEGCDVEVIVYSDSKRIEFIEEQFGREFRDWELWSSQKNYKEKIEVLLQYHSPPIKFGYLTKEKFIELLSNEHDRALNDSFAKATVMMIEEHISISLWVVDDKKSCLCDCEHR